MEKTEIKNMTESEIGKAILFEQFLIPEGFKEFVYVRNGAMSFSEPVSMNTYDQFPDSETVVGEIQRIDIWDYAREYDYLHRYFDNMTVKEVINIIDEEDWNVEFEVDSDDYDLLQKIMKMGD